MAKVPPRNPKYTPADLWPPGSQYVDFPPAAFHPVYLGNFLCQNFWDLGPRVQEYFASKGLLARMVFNRNADRDPFRAYQDKTKLYDCLVYFTRAEDAQDAIKYLHRDRYYGHRLNIFPGRERIFFASAKAVQVNQLPGVCADAPAQIIEDEVRKITSARITCCIRNTSNQVLVEFHSQEMRRKVLLNASQRNDVILTPIDGTTTMKQRFIEADAQQEMRWRLEFVQNLPNARILKALMNGSGAPAVRPKHRILGMSRHPSNHDHVIQAMKRIEMAATRRQLDMNLYRQMFPDAYKQFMAFLQASFGDPNAVRFLQTFTQPFLLRSNPLTPWEWRHCKLHNEGLKYIQGVIEKRNVAFASRFGDQYLI